MVNFFIIDAKPPTSDSSIPDPPTYKKAFENESMSRENSMVGDDKPLFVGEVPEPPTIVEADTGRKPGLPEGPIIFVAGLWSLLYFISEQIPGCLTSFLNRFLVV